MRRLFFLFVLSGCGSTDGALNPDPPIIVGEYILTSIDGNRLPFAITDDIVGQSLGRSVLSGRLVIEGLTWRISRRDTITTLGARGRISRFRHGVYRREEDGRGVRLQMVDPMFGDTMLARWDRGTIDYRAEDRDWRWVAP